MEARKVFVSMVEMGNSGCNLPIVNGVERKRGRGGVCSSAKVKAGPLDSGGAKAFQLSMAHAPQFNCALRGVNYLQTTCGGADARYSLATATLMPSLRKKEAKGGAVGNVQNVFP